jgi:ABC-type transporter Mla subunit MlaD
VAAEPETSGTAAPSIQSLLLGTLPLEQDELPAPASLLLSGSAGYADDELLPALRTRLGELERFATELEAETVDAQERLGRLVRMARERSKELEEALTRELVGWAEDESQRILRDVEQRARELRASEEPALAAEPLGELLITYFQLHEDLVRLVGEMLS